MKLGAWLLALVALPVFAQDGAAVFVQTCAPCHQPDGVGTVGLAPALKGDHWAKLGAERSYLPTVLVHGMAGMIKVNGQPFAGSMPAFGPQFDDATLAALANHVRKLQGATDAKPFAAEDIKAARDKPGSPPQTRALRVQIVGN